jgi:hypothetical protein
MRFWSTRAPNDPTPVEREDAVVTAIDAALGFVAGQRWVSRQTAIALLETVRDVTRDLDAPEHLHEPIDAAVEKCVDDQVLAAPLTDALLDIRNISRHVYETTSGGAR